MDKESNKKRTKNLSAKEKDCIISIVCKYKDIVENKCSDAKSLQEKSNVWDKITNEFNCNSEVKRCKEQLKIYYKNAKSKLKKSIAANRSEIFKTGGGSQKKTLDENNPLLSVVINETTPTTNPFDSSADYFHNDTDDAFGDSADQDIFEEVLLDESASENNTCASSDFRQNTSLGRTPSVTLSKSSKRKLADEEIKQIFKDIGILKKKKIEAEIEKNRAKALVYQKKLEILENIGNEK